jgi:LCP family protein required for cell wall assembly
MNDLDVLRRFGDVVAERSDAAIDTARDRLFTEMQVVSTGAIRGRRPPHRRVFAMRLAIAAVVVVALVVGAVALVDRSIDRRLDALRRVTLPPGVLTDGPAIGKGPVTFLVVGSDSRAGLDDDEEFGEHADLIVLVRVTGRSVRAVWIPREVSFDVDGPSLSLTFAVSRGALVDTVATNLGVAINHYVEIDMAGYVAAVDEVGGVDLEFRSPVRDEVSGFSAEPGCVHLDGAQALALARSRTLYAFQDGVWVDQSASPSLARVGRQQVLWDALAEAASRAVDARPAGGIRLFDRLSDHVTVDDTLDRPELRALARTLLAIGDSASAETLPVTLMAPTFFGVVPDTDVESLLKGSQAPATPGELSVPLPAVATC